MTNSNKDGGLISDIKRRLSAATHGGNWPDHIASYKSDLTHLLNRVEELETALRAIKDAPGGGPGKRIAIQVVGDK